MSFYSIALILIIFLTSFFFIIAFLALKIIFKELTKSVPTIEINEEIAKKAPRGKTITILISPSGEKYAALIADNGELLARAYLSEIPGDSKSEKMFNFYNGIEEQYPDLDMTSLNKIIVL